MKRSCLAKSLANTLWFQQSQKNTSSNYLSERARKKQHPFQNTPSKTPRRSSGGQHLNFFLDKRFGKSKQKLFYGNYRPATGRSSWFQGKNKRKENLVQYFFSTHNSFRRSDEYSSMGKQLVFCNNIPNLPIAGRLRYFLEVWEILTKDPEILEIVKFSRQHTWVKNRELQHKWRLKTCWRREPHSRQSIRMGSF